MLNDDAWKNAEIAKDFIIFRPANGTPVPSDYQTEVKIVYDDDAIYISAEMLDPDPEGIPREFAVRDNFTNADFFLVTINPNDDGQNPFEFIVQAIGNQADAKVSNGDEDANIIIFGFRSLKSYTNTISGKYSFSTNSSLSLSFRHYWSAVKYNSFQNLNTNGSLSENTNYNGEDVNFNS
jgi:hypothetical protein